MKKRIFALCLAFLLLIPLSGCQLLAFAPLFGIGYAAFSNNESSDSIVSNSDDLKNDSSETNKTGPSNNEDSVTIIVDNFVGLLYDEATKHENATNYTFVKEICYSTLPEGTIMNQKPAPGEMMNKKSELTLYVSTKKLVDIPDIQPGDSLSFAQEELTNAGFKVVLVKEFSADVPKRAVVRISPSHPEKAAFGSTITIYANI